MFGTKLRTWMEAHIVRSKKKKDRKKGEKGCDSNCNSPRNYGPNRSPALHQVHPVDSASKAVDGIRLHGEQRGRCGTATASSATSAGTGSVNLSSPESAYSTGYSTDGTSPGTSYPPEYYINIRTGTHYFQSNGNAAAAAAANNNNNNNNNARSKRSIDAADGSGRGHGRFRANVEPSTSGAAAFAASGNVTMDNKPSSRDVNGTPTKSQEDYSRRTESFSTESSRSNLVGPPPTSVPPPLLSPTIQSPRERSRIRTNPWLSANSSGSSSAGFKSRLNLDDASSGSGLKLTESSGSASDVNASSAREERTRREFRQESLSAGRSPINQNWKIASGMEIRPKIAALSVQRRSSSSSSSTSTTTSTGTSASNNSSGRNSSGSSSNAVSSNENENRNGNGNENGNGNGNGSGSSVSSVTRSGRSSEDDITLNEMMGKFDESYVYEKETDILSDSDPTDCEDYIESLSDVDPGQDAGDENDPVDNDDFDYIDNGPFLDLDDLDCTGRFANTGHCTYFAFTGDFARRSSKLRETLIKRRNKEDAAAMLQRTISAKTTVKRHKKPEEKQSGEKRKKRPSQRRKSNFDEHHPGSGILGLPDGHDDETANLNRVLVERMLLKNSGFNQGSRSVGGTPICLRRKKHDVNKNLSPLRANDDRSAITRTAAGDGDLETKRRSNSVSYVNGNLMRRRNVAGNPYMTTFASEMALIEADKEADKKYRELILEAENILVNMQKNQNSVPIVPSPSRKLHNGLTNKRVELIKNTELNIELALSKSRNSQPELQSGSIKDLEHTSPKRHQFAAQSCSPVRRYPEFRSANSSPTPVAFPLNPIKCTVVESPLASRRAPSLSSPDRSLFRCARPRMYDREEYDGQRTTTTPPFNDHPKPDAEEQSTTRSQSPFLASGQRAVFTNRDSVYGANRREFRVARSSNLLLGGKEEGVTSSSSDSEERYDVRRRAPLMTFRSVDMGPIKEGSSYCPQSEPVKRKVYAGSTTYGRIQKTLGEHVTLRNSDGDTATDDTDDSRRSFKEKVARLREERLAANTGTINPQDPQMFQHQLTQLRRQMLMQTIEGLKRSLEDQSATLKQTCLEPVMNDDRLP